MDPIYVKGLKDAKELFDSGVLNEAEFVAEKKRLALDRDKREARGGSSKPTRAFRSSAASNKPAQKDLKEDKEEEEEEEDQEVGGFQSLWVGAGGRSRGRVPLPAAGAQT